MRIFGMHRHAFRATHVKTQAVVKGSLAVNENLPPHLAQGLFRNPGVYPVAARYANEPSFLQVDRTPGPCGMGMKVFGIEGKHMDPSGDRTGTQDVTFNAPMLELTDLPTTLEIFKLRERHFGDPSSLNKELWWRKDHAIRVALQLLPNVHPVSYTMYSQSAFRYGDYVAKYALFPSTELQHSLNSKKITKDSSPSEISGWMQEHFREHSAEYDFKVQLLREPDRQSAEDTSKPWTETASPYETVGNVVFPAGQDAFDAARRTFWEDRMELNVWCGLEEHRPLGSVNRLRKELYKVSQGYRAEVNATPILEVSDVNEIP
ncbi:hypothetical protein H2201_001198 [Coniosporium apollinis]|uniref:Catalase core domain-containing protein n=2 Tax=Coniosporium TaxID=2810619 RepID=A0ABQ9P5E6_9PEZI|nr:hypothetical protein H2199_001609 [Cladosporium sp. JES 115]KAJ9668556.1 hypothetical protein H2201_001198 [Coniosporium apollinis]